MNKQDVIEIVSNSVDLVSKYDDEYEILNFITDNVPGLKIGFKFRECISDYILKNKLEKFTRYANNFAESNEFTAFKHKINDDLNYRNKISEYMLSKINKFDTEIKISIFSKACVDLFEGNITEDDLENVSEVLDFLTKTDLRILREIYNKYEFRLFTPEKHIFIEGLNADQISSSVKKFNILGLACDLGFQVKSYSREYSKEYGKINRGNIERDQLYIGYTLTNIGVNLVKYID